MPFQVRNELGTPAPKVLDWCSKAPETPVGAEYIIMEKATGVQLDKVWPKMNIKDRFEVAKAVSRYQKAWMSTSFSQYGSLYYSSGLSDSDGCVLVKEDGTRVKERRFAIGPSTGRGFLDDGRITLAFDRGPCKLSNQIYQSYLLIYPLQGISWSNTSWQLAYERLHVYRT